MKKINVAVLRGLPGLGFKKASLTGKNILKNLPSKYIPIDIFISKNGKLYKNEVPVPPKNVFQNVDVVFNAVHEEYVPQAQRLFDKFKVKYTGSKASASIKGLNKNISKKIFAKAGIRTPFFTIFKKGNNIKKFEKKLFNNFSVPIIVKPNKGGYSLGISLIKRKEDIIPAINEALKYSNIVIIEEFIVGREATCAVIERFGGKKICPLLPVEIIVSPKYEFYGYDAKISNNSKSICPGNFSVKEIKAIQNMSIKAHRALGLRHYSKFDFIINPKKGAYIIEATTLPGLSKSSLLPKSLKISGCSLSHFLDHIITLALNDK